MSRIPPMTSDTDDGMKQPIADALNQRLGHLWRPGLHRTLQLGRDESKGLRR
jgi:hypothetical protein